MIKWAKSSEYSIKSDCGKYHIARALVEGKEDYMLWEGTEIKGHWPTAGEAKNEAEKLKLKVEAV